MTSMFPIALFVLTWLAVDGPKPLDVRVPVGSSKVSYARDLVEAIDAKCVGCHGAALAENRLNMETVASMLKGGKRGPSIVPGKADDSWLFKMAAHRVDPVMPPREKKDLPPLDARELGLLKLWIDQGAKDDSATTPAPAGPVAIAIGSLPSGVHPINALDMTADGRRVAAGRGGNVDVFDVDSGVEIVRLGGHRDLIQSVRFRPDGRMLAAGSFQVVTTWEAPTATLERTFSVPPSSIRAMAALRDGKTLVTVGPEKTVRFWNTGDGKGPRTASLPVGSSAISLSPDESAIAVAGVDGTIRLLSVADGRELRSWKGPGGEIGTLSFLPDGQGLISLALDGRVVLATIPRDARSPVESRTIDLGKDSPARALAVSQDGRALIAAVGETIRTIRLADGKELRSFAVRADGAIPRPSGPGPVEKKPSQGAVSDCRITSVALSPDGSQLLAGSADGRGRLFEAATGRIVSTFGPLNGAIRGVAFSPRGARAFLSSGDGSVGIWDLPGGRPLIVVGEPPAKKGEQSPGWLPALVLGDGRFATAGSNVARIWSFQGSWSEGKSLGPHTSRVLAIDFSPDGLLVATGGGEPSRSGELKIWEATTGKLVRSLDTLHSDTIFALRFSPDGKKLATVSADKFLKVIDVETGKELRSLEGHSHHVLAVDWSKDGKRLVTGGADNAVKVWDYESGEQARVLNPATKQVTGLRWLAGKALVLGSSGDGTVRAWNPDNGTVPRTYMGAADYLFAVAASADGGRVTAGGADGVLLIWNGSGGEPSRRVEPSGQPGPDFPMSAP